MKVHEHLVIPRTPRRPRIAEILLEISNKMAMARDLNEGFDILANHTAALINAERGTIFLNDPQTNELYTRIAIRQDKREIRMLNHLGIAGSVFNSGTALIVHDTYTDDRFNPDIDKQTGYVTHSILCVPLRTVNGRTIGVSELLNKIGGQFTEDDRELLEALVRQAAIALESRRAAEELERDRQQQVEILRVVSEVSTEIKLGPLLEKLIGTITKMLDAERSTLFLNDETTTELYTAAGEVPGASQIRVFDSGESVDNPHSYAYVRSHPSIDKRTGFFTRSVLRVPVINKEGEIIGVTEVLNKKGGAFTAEDEARVKAFTSQIAIAIENAKLFDDVQNMKNYNESVLESMSSGVITLNEEGVVVTCNKAGLRIMKTSPEDLLRRPAKDVFTDANAWIVEKVEQVGREQKQDVTMDAEMFFANEKVSANVTILPLISTNQKKLGSLVMMEDITSAKRLKSTMSRYMDPSVAEKMLQAGAEILGGQSSVATVLFSDIRSFTTLTEELGPQATVSMLNECFTIMVDCIQAQGGTLDKFIGDAIMAVFGTPIAHDDDEDRALRASLNMLRELNTYNVKRLAEGKKAIDIGIGINTDSIVSGNIGSPRRMDYTLIGDGVNLASRLEGACKQYRAKLLISEFTFRKLQGTYLIREVDRVIVKGKTQPVGMVEILDYHTDETFPNMMQVLGSFRCGLQSYRECRWDDAIQSFREALNLNPADFISTMYLQRSEYLKKSPPPAGWSGVWKLENK
jgi:adenylate cyclase